MVYLTSPDITVTWVSDEPESSMDKCYCGVGELRPWLLGRTIIPRKLVHKCIKSTQFLQNIIICSLSQSSIVNFHTGYPTGVQDIQEFTQASATSCSLSIAGLKHGEFAYVTIRCTNTRGLVAHQTTPAMMYVQEAPSVASADVHILTSSDSVYLTTDNHQASSNSFTVLWKGFADPSGIDHYEVGE